MATFCGSPTIPAGGRLKKDERVYRNVHQPFRLQNQYFDDQVLTMLAVYMINERINYEYRIAY